MHRPRRRRRPTHGRPAATLSEIRRQKHKGYKAAITELKDGHTFAGFQALDKLGWVQQLPDDAERYQRVGLDFLDARKHEVIVGVAEGDPNEDLGYLHRLYKETHPDGSALDCTLPEKTVPTTANRRRCDRAIWAGLGRLPDTETDVPTIAVRSEAG